MHTKHKVPNGPSTQYSYERPLLLSCRGQGKVETKMARHEQNPSPKKRYPYFHLAILKSHVCSCSYTYPKPVLQFLFPKPPVPNYWVLGALGPQGSKPYILSFYISLYGGFPKLGVPFLGVPIIRTIVFWGLYWGPLILGNYHIPLYNIPLHTPKPQTS